MKRHTLSQGRPQPMHWLARFIVGLFILLAMINALRDAWLRTALDLIGLVASMSLGGLVERLVSRDTDAVVSMVAALPERRRKGLRQYLQGERGSKG